MKKPEIEKYVRVRIGLSNRPTHEDVRKAMKFAYNSGSKRYKAEAKELRTLLSDRHNLNKAIAHLIQKKDEEIEQLKWLLSKCVPKLMTKTKKRKK